MNIPDIEVHEADDLQHASTLLREHGTDARLLAGGTDLLVDLKAERVSVGHLISINRVDGLTGITLDKSGLRIGALTTPNQLARCEVVRKKFPAILDATSGMAATQVRNMATVGGNIASAIPSADMPPILTVMKASLILWSPGGERTLPLEDYFHGPRQSDRKPDEVLTTIIVPLQTGRFGAAYARFALREANACAVAGVAASLWLDSDETILEARISLSAVAPTPKLVDSAAKVLIGQKVGDDAFVRAADATMEASQPISDIRGTEGYRREVVGVLTRRALATATQRAKEATS